MKILIAIKDKLVAFWNSLAPSYKIGIVCFAAGFLTAKILVFV